MSYPRDLDEYAEEELVSEFKRRANLFNDGRCTYCGKPRCFPLPPIKRKDGTWHASDSCKEYTRHSITPDPDLSFESLYGIKFLTEAER